MITVTATTCSNKGKSIHEQQLLALAQLARANKEAPL